MSNSKTGKRRRSSHGLHDEDKEKKMDLISEEEWELREQRQQQRIQDVKVCLSFISESISGYQRLLEEQSKAEEWNHYMSCDKLPRVQHPPEIRNMIAEIRHVEDIDVQSVVNWELSVDERSQLSQDIFRKDLTRKTLEANLRPNIGQLYDKYVQRILTTMERIEQMLNSEYEIAKVPPDRVTEIVAIRGELNDEIDVLFDKLTYRIVCAPSSFKTSFDGIMESYCYKSPNYNMQIWWLANVPIRYKHLDPPVILADFDCVGLRIQLPFSVLCDNLTLRCVHTFFDHHSEGARSFELHVDPNRRAVNAGMVDIEDCLINEWLMQVNIMDEMIGRLEMKIIHYQELLREMETQTGQPAKADQKNKKKPKVEKVKNTKVKLPKEPVKLPDGMFPDPYKQFLEQEQQEFEEFLDRFFNPENLNLNPDEINLRQCSILGGLYRVICVRKPKHTDFQAFNITLHEDGRILYSLEEVRANVGGSGDDEAGHGLRSPRHTVLQDDLHLQLGADELPYFCMTFKLPEYLCRFGEPVACQFIEEDIEEHETEYHVKEHHEDVRQKKRRSRGSSAERESKSEKEPKSPKSGKAKKAANAAEAEKEAKLKSNLKTKSGKKSIEEPTTLPRPGQSIIMERGGSPKNIYRASSFGPLRLSSIHNTNAFESGRKLHNFNVTGRPLTTQNNFELQRNCLPRILSSFKFPIEFKMEKSEEMAEKAAKGCTLIRRKLVEEEVEQVVEPEYFSYEKQEGPERAYPAFDSYEKVQYHDSPNNRYSETNLKQVKIVKPHKGETEELNIYGVINTLDSIKTKYRFRPKKILDQPDFGSKAGTFMRSMSTLDAESSGGRSKPGVRISMFGGKIIPLVKPTTRPSSTRVLPLESDTEVRVSDNNSTYSTQSETIRLTKKPTLKPTDHWEQEPKREKHIVKHWTTKYIHRTEYDPDTFTFKILTDRLGVFGFAYKRYEHFPFRHWNLQYNEENNNEIIFTLDTFHVRIILYLTNAGIRGYVTKLTKEYIARPVKYMEIEEPISDYRELRRRFSEKNLNIFAEHDALYYIENGYFSVKHLAAELHVYDAIAVHCKLLKFYRSDWNRLATRRNIILCLGNPKDVNEGADVTVRVTPDSSTFVEVSEPCSDNLDVVNLSYQLTWRNIGTYSDVHQLINSMHPQATDVRNRDPKLIYYIRTLLNGVRPLSFS